MGPFVFFGAFAPSEGLKKSWIVLNLITRPWIENNKKPAISNGFLHFLGFYWIMPWRRHPDLNRGITVLQTAALATWLCRQNKMERANGFEPSTSTLAR